MTIFFSEQSETFNYFVINLLFHFTIILYIIILYNLFLTSTTTHVMEHLVFVNTIHAFDNTY